MMTKAAIKLLKDILELPSVNGKDDEGRVAEYLCSYFRAHGIKSRVQKIDDIHANVIADIPGKNDLETEIWNGHLDTVPYGDLEKWQTDPSKAVEKDGKIYARGASDMKSGLAAMVYALTHLTQMPDRNIRFIGSCDEEKTGLGAYAARREYLPDGYRFLFIGEPTNMRPGVAQKGCLWLKLRFFGKTGHGAYPEKGVNAIHYAVQVAMDMKDYVCGFIHPLLGRATAQIDMIHGGTVPNMTADRCEAVMDIRMVPGLTTEMILDFGKQAVERLQKEEPELSAEFEILNNRRAFEIEEENAHVVQLKKMLKKRGYSGEKIGISFFTDASILAETQWDKQVLLFGPGDPAMAHQPNEFVEISKYLDAIQILQEMAAGE